MYTEEKTVFTENQIAKNVFKNAEGIHFDYGKDLAKSLIKSCLEIKLTIE